MKKSRLFILLATIFTVLKSTFIYPFWPLIGAGAAVPIFGGTMNAKANSAKATLADVSVVLLYVKLFLLSVTLLSLVIFSVWLINSLKRRRSRAFFIRAITLFSRLQADLSFLKNSSLLTKEEISSVEDSKNKTISCLLDKMSKSFYVKSIDSNLLNSIKESLKLMKNDEIPVKEQIKFVSQWGDLMKRLLVF